MTDYKELNANYEARLVEVLCWKYARLAPKGKLFFVCAIGGPDTAMSFGEAYFNKINPELKKNYSKIMELRKKLFQEGQILTFLKQKFPTTNPSMKLVNQQSQMYGKYRGDLASFFIMPMIPANEEIFDTNMLKEAIEFLRMRTLKKEENDTVFQNRWKFNAPQTIVIITREN